MTPPLTISDEITGEIINGLSQKYNTKYSDSSSSVKNIKAYEMKYKYNEDTLLKEIAEYINKTYGEHYSQNNYQATEFIIDGGHGVGFTIGNILKYAQRYGRKGTSSEWRKDLMKVIHYAIIALYVHDLNNKGK
jgi:hypothetical protein